MSMLAGYGLPPDIKCTHCKTNFGRWRCKHCHLRPLLFRACCRRSHANLPFHVLERWTGTFFQRAALWEVGLTLCIPHLDGMCPILQSLISRLEAGESVADDSDQAIVQGWPGYGSRQYGDTPSQMTEAANCHPPDTDMDVTWDRVAEANSRSQRPQWEDDDIPDLQSVANSSQTDDSEALMINQVSEPSCSLSILCPNM